MGDRGNIVFKDSSVFKYPAYLYTHWGGSALKETLQVALRRGRSRWNDAQYLARIVFCEMISNGDDLNGLTGYGISTTVGDNEHNLLYINCEKQVIKEKDPYTGNQLNSWSFEDFCQKIFDEED